MRTRHSIVALITFACFVSGAFAATINVPADQPSIQAGITVAVDGDTIVVAPGTYIENIDFDGKGIILVSGQGAAVTTIQSAQDGSPVVRFDSGEDSSAALDGFTVSGAVNASGIYILNSHPVIQNCDIRSCTGDTDGAGIYCDASGAIVRYCRVFDNGKASLAVGGGICIKRDIGVPTRIVHNQIFNNVAQLGSGIGASLVSGDRIAYNTIWGNSGTGVLAGGIYINGDFVDVHNNTLYNNTHGIVVGGAAAPDVRNNISVHNSGAGFVPGLSTYDYNCLWNNGDNGDPGLHGILSNPLMVDPTAQNFSLSPQSPCINAGDPSLSFNDPNQTRNDIGAMPYANLLPVADRLSIANEETYHVISATPTLRWSYVDTIGSQSAYEIEVGVDSDWSAAELWATGTVFSADSAVVYGGTSLVDGATYYVRVRLNNGLSWGEWAQIAFRLNTAPTPLPPIWPPDGDNIHANVVRLIVENATDAEDDTISYQFVVYSDVALSTIVHNIVDIPAADSDYVVTDYLSGLEDSTTYWWRARSGDGYEFSSWSQVRTFQTHADFGLIRVPYDIPTITDAIALAEDGDSVHVYPGVYVEHLNYFGKGIVLEAVRGPDSTVLVAEKSNAAMVTFNNSEPATSVLKGFRLDGNEIGFGILCSNSSPTILDCVFTRCIDSYYSNAAAIDSRYSGITLRNNTFVSNTGRCIYVSPTTQRTVTISGNRFSDTRTGVSGMAVYVNGDGDVIIDRNLIYGNDGQSSYDAAIYSRGSGHLVTSNTIVNNHGGIRIDTYSDSRVFNNIVAYNRNRGIENSSNQSSVDYNCTWQNTSENYPGANGVEANPIFLGLYENDYRIGPQSPCVDAGHPDPVYNDADGTRGDMGALPLDVTPLPLTFFVDITPAQYGIVRSQTPTFHWTFADSGVGSQSQFEIEVGSDSDWTSAEYWATGPVTSTDTFINYAGAPLPAPSQVFYRLRVSNGSRWGDWREGQFEVRFPTTRHVPTNFPTISDAVTASHAGDTILVGPGTYRDRVYIDSIPLTILSEQGPQVTKWLEAPDPSNGPVIWVTTPISGTEISGFTFSDFDLIGACVHAQGPHVEVRVADNVFYRINKNDAIYARDGAVVRVERNLFIDCVGNPVYTETNAGGGYFLNNTVVGGTYGIAMRSPLCVIKNNIVADGLDYAIYNPHVTTVVDYNNFYNNGSYDNLAGPHGISLDPQFTDDYNRDYTLLPTSPCIDAGDPDPAFDDPDGTRNDMGAFPSTRNLPVAVKINLGPETMIRVVDPYPTFFWSILDTSGGQTAFEIEVGDNEDWSVAEQWSTGVVISSDTSVQYAGDTLLPGRSYIARIRLHSGARIGDWTIVRFRMNRAPSTPSSLEPANGTRFPFEYVSLRVRGITDPDGDSLRYQFEVYDEYLSMAPIWDTIDYVPPYSWLTVGPVPNVAPDTVYWWRCRATDGYEFSSWSSIRSIRTEGPDTLLVPSQYSTIQSAINSASNTDVIFVSPGVYDENLLIQSKGLQIRSVAGPESTRIRPTSTSTPTVRFERPSLAPSAFDGFTLEHSQTSITFHINYEARVTLTRCIFRDNYKLNSGTNQLIYVRSDCVADIRHNLFVNNTTYRTVVVAGESRIINNTFDNNNSGIHGDDYQVRTVCVNNIVTNHNLFGIKGSFKTLAYNDVWNNGSDNNGGEYGLSVDPLYISPAHVNYSLVSSSACIDAGHPDSIYNDPDGSRNDMGAFPLQSTGPIAFRLQIADNEPQHVLDSTPTFLWSYLDGAGNLPSAYEIEVGSDTNWTIVEFWSSGIVQSTDTSALYAGPPIPDGASFIVRIRVEGGGIWGDWLMYEFRRNGTPTAPVALFPPVDGFMPEAHESFMWENSTDSNGDSVTYRVEVYDDAGLQNLILHVPIVLEANPYSFWVGNANFTSGTTYWWRCRADDGLQVSEWSEPRSFRMRGPGTISVPSELPVIQWAIDRCGNGDTVLVEPGVYNENIRYNGRRVVVRAQSGRDSTTIQTDRSDSAAVTFADNESNETVLDGFTIRNLSGRGVYIDHSPVQIRNCDIRDCSTSDYGAGIYLYSSEALIKDCLIRYNTSSSAGGGIYVRYSGSETVDTLTIAGNLISGNTAPNGSAITCYYPNYVIISGNQIHDNRTSDSQVLSNDAAIYVIGSSQPHIHDNTVVSNDNGIILTASAESAQIVNNILAFNHTYGVLPQASFIDYNLFWQNGTAQQLNSHDIQADPFFFSLDSADFRLLPPSPCIDRGHPNPIYNDPDGSRADIGALGIAPWTAPGTPLPITPGDGTVRPIIADLSPDFVWSPPTTNPTNRPLQYRFHIASDSLFALSLAIDSIVDTTYSLPISLVPSAQYWWRVSAIDFAGVASPSITASFFTYTPGDVNGTGLVDIVDITYLVQFMFGNGLAVEPIYLADVNADCKVDISDLVYMIVYFFKDGPPLMPGCMNAVDYRPNTTQQIE